MALSSHHEVTREAGPEAPPISSRTITWIGAEEAISFLLHTHLEEAGSAMRGVFFDFFSAFNHR